MVDDSVDGDAISLRDAILAEEIDNSGGEITEASVEEAGRRIRQQWNRILSENLDQTLLEEIREERTVILHGTALNIIDALQHIPEPEAGSRGRRPYSNLFTMQVWMIAQWQQFRRPDLPMWSKKGESILGLLASRTVSIGGGRFHRSKDAWKRILDNATKLIRANKELESATSNIKSHIDIEKLIYRQSKDDYKEYERNQRKYTRRKYRELQNKIRQKTEKILSEIKDDEFRHAAETWVQSWLDKPN